MNYLIDLLYNLTIIVIAIGIVGVIAAVFMSASALASFLSEDMTFFENMSKNRYWILGVYIIIILLYTLTPTLDSIEEMRKQHQKEQAAHATPEARKQTAADYWY